MSQELTTEQFNKLESWIRPIQQALSIEVDKDFSNIQGRQDFFNGYISKQIVKCEIINEGSHFHNDLEKLADDFLLYPSLSKNRRQRLIAKTRQYLHSINNYYHLPIRKNSPKLVFKDIPEKSYSNLSNTSCDHDLLTSISNLKGVGPKISDKLSNLGILTIQDALMYYPRDYIDYSSLVNIDQLKDGQTATILATLRKCNSFVSPRNPNLAIIELYLQDETGRLKVSRFIAGKRFSNYSYLKSQTRLYSPGSYVAVSGLVKSGAYGKSFQDPQIEVLESKKSPLNSKSIGQIVPIYTLTEGITAEKFRSTITEILPLVKFLKDPLPKELIERISLLSKQKALISIHRPKDKLSLKKARRRLVFDEFFLLQLTLLRRRISHRSNLSLPLKCSRVKNSLVSRLLDLLPFSLTKAQLKVISEIEDDISKPEPMARLLQGDVGSGKTVVALVALLNAVESGCQGAFMAPTEVLAEQHYRTLCKWLPQLHVNVELLTGSTSSIKRKNLFSDLVNGSINILVGTHALIEDPVSFSRLGLVVVDEQHRFGVNQRNRLLNKGLQPHLLTMTATPIPRTLALSLHGDLDVSQIDEMPPNRKTILTSLLSSSSRNKAYELIRTEVLKGQRAYVVLPLVEESEKLDFRSAVEVYKSLSTEVFPDFNVGLLHGRMTSQEKQDAIKEFANGSCKVLVSTTVIEVGVDVPDATVMVIEHAERFGLAQLHQLRGRVGRGTKTSYCLLINESSNQLARQRLEILTRSNDGFEISELDLRLRGPGQVLGTKQSGLPDFALASLVEDSEVLEIARNEAKKLLEIDPDLQKHQLLKELVLQYWEAFCGKAHLN